MKKAYAVLLALALASTSVVADDRNDMMCTAIYKTAFEQEAVIEKPRPQMLEFYSGRIALFGWEFRMTKDLADTYDITVYGNFVDTYMDYMDTATALLHWGRCEDRSHEIWADYKATQQP
jgi:hypothetical protein